MTGPANPDEDPSYYPKACSKGGLPARRRGNHGGKPTGINLASTKPGIAADARRTSQWSWPVLAFRPTRSSPPNLGCRRFACLPDSPKRSAIGIEMVVLPFTNRICSDWALRSSRPLIIAVRHRTRPLFDFHSQGPCLLLAYCSPMLTSAAQHYYSFNSFDPRKAGRENRVPLRLSLPYRRGSGITTPQLAPNSNHQAAATSPGRSPSDCDPPPGHRSICFRHLLGEHATLCFRGGRRHKCESKLFA